MALTDRCAARDAALIVDEVFATIHSRRRRPWLRRTVRCSGLSFVPAWRVVEVGSAAATEARLDRGRWACAAGRRGARAPRADLRHLSVGLDPGAGRRPDLIAGGAGPRAQVLERVRDNYRTLVELASRHPSVDVLNTDAGWSAVIRVAARASEEEITLDLLEHDGVVVYPGFFFDFPREAFLVVSLLPEPAVSKASGGCWSAWMAERRDFHAGRHAGVLVPLFSIPSRSSWGVGEIADLARFAGWLRQAGLDFVQLLPVNEMQEGQNSPYSALSAMAIDPIFIALGDVPEFEDAGGGIIAH